jgi:D-ribose pyranase
LGEFYQTVKKQDIIQMQEVGTVNRFIANVISKQGHQVLMMVVDAGFPIPKDVEVVDISLSENNPMVL